MVTPALIDQLVADGWKVKIIGPDDDADARDVDFVIRAHQGCLIITPLSHAASEAFRKKCEQSSA